MERASFVVVIVVPWTRHSKLFLFVLIVRKIGKREIGNITVDNLAELMTESERN